MEAPQSRYAAPAIVLHWAIAAFILTNLYLGLRYEFYSVVHELSNHSAVVDIAGCGGYCPTGTPYYSPNYADFGPLRQFNSPDQQAQSLFAVIDYTGKVSVEFGVGHGFTAASDPLVVKLMLSFDL